MKLYVSNFSNRTFDSKDEMRIADIVTKSKGSAFKAEQLAHNMADKITDCDKALRRGLAAEMIGELKIARVFFARYGALGGR